ncbi:DUF7336 domain-containing protein [Nocardia sp. NPDC003345]
MSDIYILDHWYETDDGTEVVRTIGMYSTEARAEQAVEHAKRLPGFRNRPDYFHIERHTIGRDHWTEGFFTAGA